MASVVDAGMGGGVLSEGGMGVSRPLRLAATLHESLPLSTIDSVTPACSGRHKRVRLQRSREQAVGKADSGDGRVGGG